MIGMIFPKQALEELVDGDVDSQVDLRISSLAVKQLIREEVTHAIAGESYRFGHLQIREATYRRHPAARPRRPPRAVRRLGRAVES